MRSFCLCFVSLVIANLNGCVTRKADVPLSFESQMARVRKLISGELIKRADLKVCESSKAEVFAPLPEYFRLLPEPEPRFFAVNECDANRVCVNNSRTGSVFTQVVSEPNTLQAAPILKWEYLAEKDLCSYTQTSVMLTLQGDDLVIKGNILVFEVPKRCDYASFESSKFEPTCNLSGEARAIYW